MSKISQPAGSVLSAQEPPPSGSGSCFFRARCGLVLRTFVYVDGFNLFHRALKGTKHKWIDLVALSRSLLGANNVVTAVKYYTARVTGRQDAQSPGRQQTYLNALESLPEVQVFFGRFMAKTITRPLVNPSRVSPVLSKFTLRKRRGRT